MSKTINIKPSQKKKMRQFISDVRPQYLKENYGMKNSFYMALASKKFTVNREQWEKFEELMEDPNLINEIRLNKKLEDNEIKNYKSWLNDISVQLDKPKKNIAKDCGLSYPHMLDCANCGTVRTVENIKKKIEEYYEMA